MDDDARTRLLARHDQESNNAPTRPSLTRRFTRRVERYRSKGRDVLASHMKHYVIMFIVVLDVVALLVNVFIQLIACEMGELEDEWVQKWKKGLEEAGLVFSCLFMIEVLLCFFSFGLGYFSTFFHIFDTIVVVLSLVIDIAAHGLTESIGSLVVVLRLWRLAKISEEVVLGATERMEVLEQQMEELGNENQYLREQLARSRNS